MNLSSLSPPRGQNHPSKRVGRGMGSGHGKTATRGSKGQRSGTGFSQKRGFEGGQMPLHRRLPKRGFTNIFKKQYAVLNLDRLDKLEGDVFTPLRMIELGAIRPAPYGVKILGRGQITRPVTVSAHRFSKGAAEKIAAAGGKVEVLGA